MIEEFKFLFNKLPFYLIIYPTSRCNAACPHCFNHKRQGSALEINELTLSEYEKIAGKLEHVKVLTITGGEPFLRDDIAEIVSLFCSYNGLQYVSFHTNGSFPQKTIEAVSILHERHKRLNIIVCVSIDGIGAEHDNLRKHPGSFKSAVMLLKRLQELQTKIKKLNIVTSSICCRSTKDNLENTISFIRKELPGIRPTVSFLRGEPRDMNEKKDYNYFYAGIIKNCINNNPSSGSFSGISLKNCLENISYGLICGAAAGREIKLRCMAGKKTAVIFEDGEVFPCEGVLEGFGNLRDNIYDMKQLMFSESGRKLLEKIGDMGRCGCTWENIIPVNLIYSPKHYPAVIKGLKENAVDRVVNAKRAVF